MSAESSDVELGTLDYAILGLLSDMRLNGYDVRKWFDLSVANAWSAQHSQIYPALGKLEGAGLIEVVGVGTRRSKIYHATTLGVEAVKGWLKTEAPRTVRSESVLRMFFLWLLGDDEIVAYLEREEAYHRERLERFRSLIETIPPNPDRPDRWNRVMLERAVRSETMIADWAQWATDQVEAPANERRETS